MNAMVWKSCMLSDCPNDARARGVCIKHYRVWQRHGNAAYVAGSEERTDEGEPIAVIHTEQSGSWAVPPALEVLCCPAICKGCGHHPTDCECED